MTDTLTAAEYRRLNGLPPPGADRTPRNLRISVATETALQIAVADWLRALEFEPPSPVWFHVANERKSKMESIRSWRMGQLAGVPDLIFLLPGGRTFSIELKLPKGSLTDSQRELHPRMRELEHPVEVSRSLDAVRDELARQGVRFRETPLAKAMRESAR